jgi:hypothetical protein
MGDFEPNQEAAADGVEVVAQQDAISLQWAAGGAIRIVQRDEYHNESAVVFIRPEHVARFVQALQAFVA